MKRLLPVLLLFSAGLAISQSVAPQVTAAAGDHFTGANAQLSWTIGEVVIKTLETETNQLTQGFHQTNLLITAVEDLAKDFQVKIYPNPTAAIMKIQWKETVDAMILSLYNHQGQQVMRQSIVGQVFSKTIDLGTYPTGSYWLRLSDPNGKVFKSFKVLKIK